MMQFTTSYIIAASQLFAFAMGAPLLQADAREARSLVERAAYTTFGGDGSAGQGWPTKSDWKSFEDLWKANEKIIGISCSQYRQENNSPSETASIKTALLSVAKETKIDERVLLAVMMEETKGCVRAPTTSFPHQNPGLMQSFQGKNSCYNAKDCSKDTITGMIRDGAGVGAEMGLMQAIAKAGGNDAQTIYRAGRIYNSGSFDTSNLGKGIAKHCYSSDIANRLLGWSGDKDVCDENTIGNKSGGAPRVSTTEAKADAPSGEDDKPAENNNNNTTCAKKVTIKPGDTCASTGVSAKLNPDINAACSNLMPGKTYCAS